MKNRELIDLAIKLYQETGNGNKVAKKIGVAPTTLYKWLHASGIHVPGRFSQEAQNKKKLLKGELATRCASDYASDMKMSVIQKKYKCSAWAIRTAAKDAGVEMRNRGGRYRKFSDKDRQEAKRLYEKEKWSQEAIAAKFGSTQITVSRMLKEVGCKTRGRAARGKEHGGWKGGRVKVGDGYIGVMVDRNDPWRCMADSMGYVLEHRLVMAKAMGRPLLKHETVHHIDGDKHNNKISNLQLRFGRHGKGIKLKCRQCGSCDIIEDSLG